ncbi:MAG TPA: alpha/beta hydrolase [Acidobacteriota bacterium]|nr:alpha/beta hydrolase [Acidobacteriota bacterium]
MAPALLAVFGFVAAQTELPRREREVPYVRNGNSDQVLDISYPKKPGFPTVIFIHGGSLRRGDTRKSDHYAGVCEPFLKADIGCANIDYRLAPDFRWPAMPRDVTSAVRWVKDNIGSRGGDPSRIFLFGHSSGCHLAATLGTNQKYLREAGLETADIAGVIAMGCTLAPLKRHLQRAAQAGASMDDLAARWAERSDETRTYESFQDRLDSDPSRHVGQHTPPTLIVIAEGERFHPPILEQGAFFVDLMYDAKRPADIVIVPGSHYSSIIDITQPDDPTFSAILSFIANPSAAGLGSRGWR